VYPICGSKPSQRLSLSRTLRQPCLHWSSGHCASAAYKATGGTFFSCGISAQLYAAPQNGGEELWHHRHDGLGRRVDIPLVVKPEFGRVSHRTSLEITSLPKIAVGTSSLPSMTAVVSVNVCSEAIFGQTHLTKSVMLSTSEQLSAIELRHHSNCLFVNGFCTLPASTAMIF
jgi:hypothetical protein